MGAAPFMTQPLPGHRACAQRAQTVRRDDTRPGVDRIDWWVESKKIRNKDRSLVSPVFSLAVNASGDQLKFKLMVKPHGKNFLESRGRGFVQLRCEVDIPEELVSMYLGF